MNKDTNVYKCAKTLVKSHSIGIGFLFYALAHDKLYLTPTNLSEWKLRCKGVCP